MNTSRPASGRTTERPTDPCCARRKPTMPKLQRPGDVPALATGAGASRRALLKSSAALAAGLSGLASPAIAQTAARPKDVLVLGAGMSGLTAALALVRRGHAVTVIEHQDRVGG